MKLLCLVLIVLAVSLQAQAKPKRAKLQSSIPNHVPIENIKSNLGKTRGNPEADIGNSNVTTQKPYIIMPRHEKIAPLQWRNTPAKMIKSCKEGEFLCDGDLCVSKEKYCDGRINCRDGTDEDDCAQVKEHSITKTFGTRGGCDAEYSHPSGTIVFPVGGGNYENNEVCKWVIKAGTPIQITFTSFQVETKYDFLEIRDGDSSGSPVLDKLSGHSLPEPVETTGNDAFLEFTSDYSVTFPGFELHWAPSGCGEVFTSSNGVINYPMNGGNYENDINCVWKINAAEPIKITFVRFDLEANYDFLYIRNGPNSDSQLLGTFTGSSIPAPVETTQNSAYLLFTSDFSVTRTGFGLRWEPASTTGPSECKCGRANQVSRIVNGEETKENEYPWQISQVWKGTSSVFCGGSIIGTKHILTAAHCEEPAYNFDVLVGAHSMKNPSSSQARLTPSEYILHRHYNAATIDNDIAVIALEGSISFTNDVRPVCLPTSNNDDFDDVEAFVSGWGHTNSGGTNSDVLLKVTVPTMSNDKCKEYYGNRVTPNMICAGYEEGGKDSCQNDSGGPLTYKAESGSYIQIGVVSHGAGCALPKAPGVYTRVSNFLPWIAEKSASSITCQAA